VRYVGLKMLAVLLGLAAVALGGCGEDQLLDESEQGIRLPLADTKRPVLSNANPSTPYTAETAKEMDVANDPGRPISSAGGAVINTTDQQPLQPEVPRYRANLDKVLAVGDSEPSEPPGATDAPPKLTISEEGQRLKVVNLIVAEVNGEIITREDLLRPIRSQMAQWSKALDEKEFEARVRLELSARLRAEISRQLALQEAKKQAREEHVKHFEKEVEKKRQRLVAMYGGSIAKWRQTLAAAGLTEDQWRQKAIDRMMVQYFLNEAIGPKISVTRQELLDYYQRVRQERYQPKAQARMQLIRLRRRDYAGAEAVLSLARSLVRRARNGEDFAALARKYSTGSRASEGGLWPSLGKGSYHEDAVDAALFSQAVGTVCDPIVCPRDVYVIKPLERVKGRTIPFTEVQDEVEAAVRNAKFEEMVGRYIQKLYQKAYIRIFQKNL